MATHTPLFSLLLLCFSFGLARAAYDITNYYTVQWNTSYWGTGANGTQNFYWGWRNKCVSYVGPLGYHHIIGISQVPGQPENVNWVFCHGQLRDPKTEQFYNAKDPYNSTSDVGPIFDGTPYVMNRFNFYHVATGFNLTTHQTYSGPVYAMNATDGYTIPPKVKVKPTPKPSPPKSTKKPTTTHKPQSTKKPGSTKKVTKPTQKPKSTKKSDSSKKAPTSTKKPAKKTPAPKPKTTKKAVSSSKKTSSAKKSTNKAIAAPAKNSKTDGKKVAEHKKVDEHKKVTTKKASTKKTEKHTAKKSDKNKKH